MLRILFIEKYKNTKANKFKALNIGKMILRIVKLKIWLIVMQLMDTVAEKGHSQNIFPKSTNVFQIDNFFSNQKIFFNPCMESKIQKIKFLKNQNSIFPFFKF